ncbi:MAG: sugar transferase [Candidatus Omnitrophica bacterium]|nr:sugar transferase [Candidatus Omnitrophota bacterium]
MWRRKRIIFIRIAYLFLDIVCVSLSVLLACVIRRGTLPFEPTFQNLFLGQTHPFQFVFVFWVFAVVFFNHIHGLYHTRREILEGVEIWQVTKSVLLSGIVTIVVIYILKIEGFPRSILILTGVFINILLSVWRWFKRLFVNFLVVHGYNNFNVLVIGAGKVGEVLAQEIEKHPGFGMKVIGFLDDFKPYNERCAGHPILGKLSDLPKIVREEFINKIFITIHHDSKVFLQLLEQARDMNVAVRVVPQGFEFTTGELFKYNVGLIPVLEYSNEENIIKQTGKRIFDLLASFFLLVLLSPVFLWLAILIKKDSPGPVLYSSKRYGRRGRKFNMYKFRSMVADADTGLEQLQDANEVDGPIFKIKKDPRITKTGKFLRRYSLDELPQIFNVFKGDMSLVGPRPLPIEQIEKEDLRQLKRLAVRPGITGLWQIRGRSDISFARLVKWDIWYINNWSFWLDLNILLQTIPVVLKGKGAY